MVLDVRHPFKVSRKGLDCHRCQSSGLQTLQLFMKLLSGLEQLEVLGKEQEEQKPEQTSRLC
jgi:hypothetical protein